MSHPVACPVCASTAVGVLYQLPEFDIKRCESCGTRFKKAADPASVAAIYESGEWVRRRPRLLERRRRRIFR